MGNVCPCKCQDCEYAKNMYQHCGTGVCNNGIPLQAEGSARPMAYLGGRDGACNALSKRFDSALGFYGGAAEVRQRGCRPRA